MEIVFRSAAIMAAGLVLTGSASPTDCTFALRVTAAKACVVNPHGVVLAPDRVEAERLAGLARDGEVLFARHFNGPPAKYAVVQDAPAGVVQTLTGAGFASVLPWLTDAQVEAGVTASLRRGAEAQAKAAGLAGKDVTETGDAAVADWRARNTGEARRKQEAGVVPHEAGHGWYVARYWPGARVDGGGGHYGGPGPDWLDETAAVLMESEGFAGERRAQFERIYRGTATGVVLSRVRVAELIDLPLFLSRDHPAKGLLSGAATTPGAPGIRILAGAEALEAARGAILFYLQSRVFADYLIERTNPAIFGEIGGAFGRGRTMQQWLATDGRRHRLPTSVAALDADWRAWLSARFGPPVAKAAS